MADRSSEIERKFLLPDAPPWLAECESSTIEQGYLALGNGEEARLRRRGEQLRLTVKRGSGLTRMETEIELSPEQFDALWPLTEGRRVSKRRHLREAPEGTFEIDVYIGSLEGLLTAEIEFGSEAEAQAFDPPSWLGPELTGDRRYSNAALATEGTPSR